MVVAGAVLFAAAGAWRVIGMGPAPAYLTVVLPSMLLWGIANALIQPALFACADAVPRDDLASGSAVLSMARQLGSALGVAVLVALVDAGGAAHDGGVDRAALVVFITAGLTTCAGLATGERIHRRHTATCHDRRRWGMHLGRRQAKPRTSEIARVGANGRARGAADDPAQTPVARAVAR